MIITNKDIRIAMIGHKKYRVAEELGITEFTFSRWLRKEFTPERRAQVLAAIERLSKGAVD